MATANKRKLHAFSQNQADEFDSLERYEKLESTSDYKKNKFFSDGMNIESSESYHDSIMRKQYDSNNDFIDPHDNMQDLDDYEMDDIKPVELPWYQNMFKHEYKPYWFAAILAISLFLERFCFIVTVYKTREHGYILILIVALLNSIFSLLNSMIKKKKHKRKLFENFQMRKTPKVGICVFILISILDMFYVFFLFWPANVIPIACLITLLQLLIPLNMIYQSSFKIHKIAGLIIIAACVVSFIRVTLIDPKIEDLKYCAFLVLSAVLQAISLGIKEGLVRTQAINNEKFNFKVSLGQFIIGILIMPIIVDIYTSSTNEGKDNSTWKNIGDYIVNGLKCVVSFSKREGESEDLEKCSYSMLYVVGYTLATFLFQIVLKALLERRRKTIIKKVFMFTIPLTVASFALGALAIPGSYHGGFGSGVIWIDILSVGLAFCGVFLFNSYEEKMMKIKDLQKTEHRQ